MRIRSRIIALAIAGLASGCALSHSHRPSDSPNLHHVKRVYFEPGDQDSKPLEGFLAEALARRGFVIAGAESDSEATVIVWAIAEMVVDRGDRPVPAKYGFSAELKAPTVSVDWKTTIHSVVEERHPDAQRRNMETIAERLFKAWKESAVRAGDLTSAQARTLERIR